MKSRRKFLGNVALTTAALSTLPHWAAPLEIDMAGKSISSLGLILDIVKKEMLNDAESTLSQISKLGYTKLEFSEYYGYSKAEFKKLIQTHGFQSVAGGGSMYDLQDNFDDKINDAVFFEKEYLVCYWPWMDDGSNKTLDDFKKLADTFNTLGRKCKKEGLKLAFHAHDKEFYKINDTVPYDILLKNTDKDLVAMELDLYWIKKGGQDPLKYVQNYGDRFSLIHVKDMDNSAERNITCPGDGIIDFKSIFNELSKYKNVHYLVERDRAVNGMQCLTDSADYLFGLRW
ncbi:sugar phosphate isomerase/epimerase family protein [Galbibacter mesophilus]|uniref:sugar phosphate isomerase/epimerase family protein n=1 Tax=Galbibacter mesophilus TaxID=379069 RepID=UPI00191F68F1|nr:sugar phosphate isomerase/epimerase [Galbibacter mesophilus]MCM5663074.1 sugar phosphate isomerase/epimerase [Galbibacter mesophilus]